jgi:hypothetical protein
MLLSYMEGLGFTPDGWSPGCFFDRYSGEALTGGRGEILMRRVAE